MRESEPQKADPQHSHQKVGCGFPLAKLVVWFCGTTGAVLEVVSATFNTSEWQLARQLYATLPPEDGVVADSADGTDVDLALVRAAQADGVFRKHHARQCAVSAIASQSSRAASRETATTTFSQNAAAALCAQS